MLISHVSRVGGAAQFFDHIETRGTGQVNCHLLSETESKGLEAFPEGYLFRSLSFLLKPLKWSIISAYCSSYLVALNPLHTLPPS